MRITKNIRVGRVKRRAPLPARGFSVLLPCHYRSLLVPIQAFNGGLSQAILPIRTHSSGKVVAKVSEPGSPKAQPSH